MRAFSIRRNDAAPSAAISKPYASRPRKRTAEAVGAASRLRRALGSILTGGTALVVAILLMPMAPYLGLPITHGRRR